MSGFVPNSKFCTSFEGDEVCMVLSPLKRKDVQTLAPFISQEDDGQVKMSFKEQLDFLNAFSDMMPDYVADFSGLKDESGNEVLLEIVFSNVYFMELSGIIVGELMNISRLRQDEEGSEEIKKSSEPPADA